MDSRLFSIKYADKHAAALVFKQLQEVGSELGVTACGLEKCKTGSRRIRTHFRIILSVKKEYAFDLPSKLKIIQRTLKDHPLYSYLSFDYCVVPISQTEWNFDSYEDPNYQAVFVRKRSN